MSIFKDDYWTSENRELSVPAELRSLSVSSSVTRINVTNPRSRLLRAVTSVTCHSVAFLVPNSLQWRLLLAPIAGPMAAFSVLIAVGDLTEPRWILSTFALATALGLMISAVITPQLLRSLAVLVAAASRLGIYNSIETLPETGPSETRAVAKAFNAMADRVSRQVEERVRLLTAFSHDMQTPITRMRLRLEMTEPFPEREKMFRDLDEAERLIRDGIAYARNSHVFQEASVPVDLCAFIESIVYDYQDTGRSVRIIGDINEVREIKPGALRRVLSNFIDNALKFAGAGEVLATRDADGGTRIAVVDRGPGIDPEKLDAVMRPFVRLPQRRGKQAAGAGLGLAIAHQLATEMNASLVLENRPGGGLSAQIVFASTDAASAVR